MTEGRTERIAVSDGCELLLTIAAPESVVRGGIVVFPEARGVTNAVQRLADGLADQGWLVVVPHLYQHRGVEQQSAAAVLSHVDASLGWLTDQGVSADRMGAVGFGLGGTVALLVATQRDLGAVVTVNGIGIVQPVCPTLPPLVEVAPDLRCPWLGVYDGAGPIPEAEVHKLRDAVDSAQVATDLVHCADGTCTFDADQSAVMEAWTRTLNWFDSHLR